MNVVGLYTLLHCTQLFCHQYFICGMRKECKFIHWKKDLPCPKLCFLNVFLISLLFFPKPGFFSVFKVLGLRTWSIILPSENLLGLIYGLLKGRQKCVPVILHFCRKTLLKYSCNFVSLFHLLSGAFGFALGSSSIAKS